MPQFKAGDTVRLKSGGPLMTVSDVDSGGYVTCEWFDDKNAPQRRSFVTATLEADDGTVAGF